MKNSDQNLTDEKLRLKIDSTMEEVIQPEIFSGVVALVKDYNIIYYSSHGYANRTLQIPHNLDTKFNLGSLNKMITSIAIAKLVQERKLSFDNTVADIIPEAKIDRSDEIKIHHLLTHTSGLGNFFTKEYMENKDKYLEVGDLLPIIIQEKASFSPGESVQYSNSGFEVLGMIIEKLSGVSYFDFVRTNVYEPVGMKNTDSYRRDEQISNMAEGYTRMSMKGPDVREDLHSNKQILRIRGSAAGGGYSTVNDLILFSKAIFSYKLLTEELTKTVLKGKIQPDPENPNTKIAYGFGSRVYDNVTRYGHSGGAPGCNTFFGFYQPGNYTLIVLSNFDPPAAENVVKRLDSIILTLG